MNSEPIISIIVPVFNVEEYLEDCINSILTQSYKNIELILVDDGSTDASGEICDKYAKIDNRIVVLHKTNGGVSSARNYGIKYSKGKYIGFVDADDYIEPQMYQYMLKNMLSYNAQICVNIACYKDKKIYYDSEIEKDLLTAKEAISNLLQMNFPTSLCNCLYDKEIIKNEFLNEDIHFWEDFEYQLRLLYKSRLISICRTPFYHYRQRVGSANNQIINDKIITCLKIANIVEKSISFYYPDLKIYASELNVIFLLHVIGYLSKSKYKLIDTKYFKIITKYARKYLFITYKSKQLNFIKKFYITLCAINSKLYYFIYKNIGNQVKMIIRKFTA